MRAFWEIGDETGKGIAFVFGDDESNAEFIVRACNVHADLLAACEVALKRMKDSLAIRVKLTGITTGAMAEEVAQLEAAVRKARGEF